MNIYFIKALLSWEFMKERKSSQESKKPPRSEKDVSKARARGT